MLEGSINEDMRAVIRRLGLGAAALLLGAVLAFGAVVLMRHNPRPVAKANQQGENGPPAATLAQPLGPGATQVSLNRATTTFGPALALPNTSAVQPSDSGPVWELSSPGATTVAVTFPSKGLFIQYSRPATYTDPLSAYETLSGEVAGSQLVQLDGEISALYVPANDGSGTNSVDFETRGVDIRVSANDDEATLEAIAQSIIAKLASSGRTP